MWAIDGSLSGATSQAPPPPTPNRSDSSVHQINVAANVLLLVAKVIALFFTPSLSLIASTTDSALDLLCTLIIWTSNTLVRWRLHSLQRKFPAGRRRLEPLGILVFSVVMVVSFLQILQGAVGKLLPSGDHKTVSLPPVAIGAMLANTVVKGIIGLGCRPIKTTQVQALVQGNDMCQKNRLPGHWLTLSLQTARLTSTSTLPLSSSPSLAISRTSGGLIPWARRSSLFTSSLTGPTPACKMSRA
jgi:hypothetical protein